MSEAATYKVSHGPYRDGEFLLSETTVAEGPLPPSSLEMPAGGDFRDFVNQQWDLVRSHYPVKDGPSECVMLITRVIEKTPGPPANSQEKAAAKYGIPSRIQTGVAGLERRAMQLKTVPIMSCACDGNTQITTLMWGREPQKPTVIVVPVRPPHRAVIFETPEPKTDFQSRI